MKTIEAPSFKNVLIAYASPLEMRQQRKITSLAPGGQTLRPQLAETEGVGTGRVGVGDKEAPSTAAAAAASEASSAVALTAPAVQAKARVQRAWRESSSATKTTISNQAPPARDSSSVPAQVGHAVAGVAATAVEAVAAVSASPCVTMCLSLAISGPVPLERGKAASVAAF